MYDITSGEGRVIKSDKIHSPRRVCAGPAGTVFVCSGDSQLSPQGDVLMTNDVGMKRPTAISLSRDGARLAVSSSGLGPNTVNLLVVSR